MRPPFPSRALLLVTTLTMTSLSCPSFGEEPKGRDRVKVDGKHAEPKQTQSSGDATFENALRLARALHDDAVVARLLRTHALTKGAKEGDLLAVVEAYETAGHPERAASFLRERIQKFPKEPRTRVMLATLLARSQDTKDALAVWKDYEAAFGLDSLPVDDALRYARDLSRAGDVDGAYAILQKVRSRAPDDAKEYWMDLATLAWERDDDEAALAAYEKVYALDKKALHVALRIATLLVDAHRLDDATPIALEDYKRSDDPAGVLLVAHTREQTGEWAKLRELIDAADAAKGALAKREDWLLLEGDTLKQLGDRKAALERYARALAVAPRSVEAKGSILWTSLEMPDPRAAREAVQAFTAASRDEPALWAPMALALVKLGRTEEALPWFERHIKSRPDDAHILLDYADALAKLGRQTTAGELRRRAVARMRADAVTALHAKTRTEEDALVLGSTATVVRERSGVTQGDRWLEAIARNNPRLVGQEETAVDAFLETDRTEYARRVMARIGKASEQGPMLRHRLAVAIADDDRPKIASLLDRGGDLTDVERANALVALGRERAAIGAIGEALAKNDEPAEAPALREDLVRIGPAHQPRVRAGATYVHVTGLDVYGPTAGAEHDFVRGRLVYSAYGVRMNERAGLINLPDPVYEADAGALYRETSERGVTEVGVWGNYQTGTPVGRAQLFDERLLTSRLGITTDIRLSDKIEDTSFLRVAGIRHHAKAGLRYDWPRFYATAEVEGREDQTRKYKHLAWDAVENAEVGFKILPGEPELSVGVQLEASQRRNKSDGKDDQAAAVASLPFEVRNLILPRVDIVRALPPTFQLLGGAVHLSRGDYLDRYRPDRAPFPRYDCEAAFGILFPDADPALHVQCGASIRAPGGYASVYGFYNRGIAGVENNENAEATLAYTMAF